MRHQENEVLSEAIKTIYHDEKQRVGSPRITARLRASGRVVGKNRVAHIMRKLGFRAKGSKKFKATTNSRHKLPVAENLLKQDFSAFKENQKWVSDITYIWTSEGWLYLAVVLDLYSRMVVGWAMSERMTATLVCDALKMAIWCRKRPVGVIIHSDRGVQYASYEFQLLLKKYGLIGSMSRKGNCWDNAPCESFFHTMKNETVGKRIFNHLEEVKSCLFDYIEVFYNRKRLHSTIGYTSPESYEKIRLAS